MSSTVCAGVDWAGGGWLAVYIKDGSYDNIAFEAAFEELWAESEIPSLVLVDVPIGLPEDEQSLANREELDSCARSVTARPSSVFPVPSRGACQIAYEDNATYEEVVERNEYDLEKGLNWQSYHIAKGIGEVDTFLRRNNSTTVNVIEAHPEVCFRYLHGQPLEYSKNCAAGSGERLSTLQHFVDNPGEILREIICDLPDASSEDLDESEVEIDDVLDALGLGLIASRGKEELEYIPENYEHDPRDIPMRMAYWSGD